MIYALLVNQDSGIATFVKSNALKWIEDYIKGFDSWKISVILYKGGFSDDKNFVGVTILDSLQGVRYEQKKI